MLATLTTWTMEAEKNLNMTGTRQLQVVMAVLTASAARLTQLKLPACRMLRLPATMRALLLNGAPRIEFTRMRRLLREAFECQAAAGGQLSRGYRCVRLLTE